MMTALGVTFLLLWCTGAVLLLYGALRVAARADTVEDGFDRDCSGDNALLSVGPSAGSGTDEEGGEG